MLCTTQRICIYSQKKLFEIPVSYYTTYSPFLLIFFTLPAHTGTLLKQIAQVEHLKQMRLLFELTS